jgi:hypothetical protein
MKPKAAAMAPSVAGTTSCRAPQVSPPSGRCESMAVKPSGSACRRSPIPGMSRRSSAITAARLRAKECGKECAEEGITAEGAGAADAGVESPMDILCMFLVSHHRTKREQCQDVIEMKDYSYDKSMA